MAHLCKEIKEYEIIWMKFNNNKRCTVSGLVYYMHHSKVDQKKI